MRIESLRTGTGPFKEGLQLLTSNALEKPSKNHTTVLVGANGSSKSLALRLLTDAALGINKFETPGYPQMSLEIEGVLDEPVSKVIAVSGTPLDRFPRGGRPGPIGAPTQHDLLPYTYIGQKASNSMAGSRQSERTLAYLLFRHFDKLNEFSEELTGIFTRLGLHPNVRISFSPRLGLKSASALREHVLRELDLMVSRRSKHENWVPSPELAETENYARRLLDEEDLAQTVANNLMLLKQEPYGPTISISGDIDRQRFESLALGWKSFYMLAMLRIVNFRELAFIDAVPPSDAHRSTIRGDDLSSGQWHWLSSLCGVLLEGADSSLILVDEPENSLHPNWQREYLPELLRVLSRRNGCHLIVATHSPLIASSLPQGSGSVLAIRRTESEPNSSALTYPIEPTFGWSATDVLEQVFSMESTRAPEFSEIADEALTYIADGKHKHRKKLAALAATLEHLLEGFPAHDPMRRVVQSIVDEVNATDPKQVK